MFQVFNLPAYAIKPPSFQKEDHAVALVVVFYALKYLRRLIYVELGPNAEIINQIIFVTG